MGKQNIRAEERLAYLRSLPLGNENIVKKVIVNKNDALVQKFLTNLRI